MGIPKNTSHFPTEMKIVALTLVLVVAVASVAAHDRMITPMTRRNNYATGAPCPDTYAGSTTQVVTPVVADEPIAVTWAAGHNSQYTLKLAPVAQSNTQAGFSHTLWAGTVPVNQGAQTVYLPAEIEEGTWTIQFFQQAHNYYSCADIDVTNRRIMTSPSPRSTSFSDTDACDALATASTPTTDVTAGDDLSVTWQGGVGADVTIYLVPTADVENVAAATAVVLASDVQTTSFTYTIPSNLEGEYTVRFVWRSSSNCADLVIAPRPLPVGAPPGSTWTSDNKLVDSEGNDVSFDEDGNCLDNCVEGMSLAERKAKSMTLIFVIGGVGLLVIVGAVVGAVMYKKRSATPSAFEKSATQGLIDAEANNNDDDYEAPAANLAAPSSTKSSKPSRGQLSVSGTY